jgi:hypothetical protein
MPSTTYTGSECVVGWEVSKQPPWSIGDVDERGARLQRRQHLARDELRRPRAGDEHGADDEVRVLDGLVDRELVRHRERDAPVEHHLEVAHPLDRLVQDPHVGLHAHGDESGVVADDPTAEDDDLGRRHSRQPPRRIPRPPCAFSSAQAPICVARRPATSLIGASSGSWRSSVSTVS